MKTQMLILLSSMIISMPLFAQSRYPIAIPGGEQVRLDVPITQDTVWVLSHSQYKKAIELARLQEIDSFKVQLLQQKITMYAAIMAEKDSLVSLSNKGYNHYRDLWGTTTIQLEKAEIKAAKNWRFFQGGFVAGTIVTIVTSAYFLNFRK